MILNTRLAVLTKFRTLVSIFFPAMLMHPMIAFGHDHLSGTQILLTIMSYPALDIFLRLIFLIIFGFESEKPYVWNHYLHNQEEESERQNGHQQSYQ